MNPHKYAFKNYIFDFFLFNSVIELDKQSIAIISDPTVIWKESCLGSSISFSTKSYNNVSKSSVVHVNNSFPSYFSYIDS